MRSKDVQHVLRFERFVLPCSRRSDINVEQCVRCAVQERREPSSVGVIPAVYLCPQPAVCDRHFTPLAADPGYVDPVDDL